MEPGIHGGAGAEFSTFIGRDSELTELRLLAPGARALTLCGAGGIGKTRLAVRVITELAPDFPDGAWFVELADLRQPDLVAARIASAVGVVEEPGRPLLATLADVLRPRRALIGLDTCEHLIDACARVCQRLLASSPGLRVIATSREPLRVAAETVWQVPPLSLPPPGADDAELANSDAIALFADRARAARRDFVLWPGSLPAVTAICRALDGLPLAIELAAAWVRALSVEQIAARLADRFRLLSSAERTAPPRHRTLRAAIDWSHDLLSAPERILLRRLSVFASWPLEMAEQVCGGPAAGGEITAASILDLLTALADKSLVIAEPDSAGRTRYRMLDTIRDYAAARLSESGESQVMHARFRDYAVREVEQLSRIGMALAPATWADRVASFRRFDDDAANLSQLLGRCLADDQVEAGLRICVSMRPVWIVQGSFAVGAGWIDAFLARRTSAVPAEVLGSALVGRAQLALASDPAQAGQLAKVGLALCRTEGSEFWAASALNLLAEVALHAGQPDEAAARAGEAMAVAAGSADRFNEAYASGTLGAVAAVQGDLPGARRLGEAALAIARDIDQQWAAARALLGLGDLARLTGDQGTARQHYEEALAILRGVSARPEIARCLAGLGRMAISQADLALARRYLTESIELSRSTGSRIGVIRSLDAFATLAAAQSDPGLAVTLAAAAAALRQSAALPEAPASRTQRILDAAADLGERVVKDLWEQGLALGSEAAIERALSASGPAKAPDAPDVAVSAALTRSPAADGQAGQAQAGQASSFRALERPDGGLTPRERDVAALIAQGRTNKAIAAELVISPTTVARHVANILVKLGMRSRVQIAAWALERPTDRERAR